MRRAEGKDYGYIILPIVVADGADPSSALNSDKQYKQVWQVLNALRSTDERFEAEVNKLDLNKKNLDALTLLGLTLIQMVKLLKNMVVILKLIKSHNNLSCHFIGKKCRLLSMAK